MKISKKACACSLSPMRKFHPYAVAAQAAGKTIYHLNIGQPDIETPQVLFDMVRGFDQKVLEYAPSPGKTVMLKAVQDYYARIGIQFEQSDILITTGGSEALQILMFCILDEGSEVVVAEPFYPNYDTMIRAAGGTIRPIPTCPEEGYCYATREKLEAAITPNTRAIMVTNPGNPTGVVLTPEQMRLLADVAKEHGLYIIGDEVYREFCYNGDTMLRSMAQLADVAENVVIIDSVSKRFSACGARVGALLSKNHELMANALKFCQVRLSVATRDQVAAAELYTVDTGYFDNVREEYRRRDTCYEALRKIPGVVCTAPEGAFYMMAKLPVDDTEAFQQWLLEDFSDQGETVMFAPGSGFYATPGSGRQEIRIAYVLEQERLERAMELLGLAVEQYQREVMHMTE